MLLSGKGWEWKSLLPVSSWKVTGASSHHSLSFSDYISLSLCFNYDSYFFRVGETTLQVSGIGFLFCLISGVTVFL